MAVPKTILDTDQFPLTCEATNTRHVVSLGLPVRSAALDSAPLLFCLDGPWMFGTTLDATRIMSMSGDAPEAIVVGMSFAEGSMGEYLRQRARWYTPTSWIPPVVTGVRGLGDGECGRAGELMAFVDRQVLPAVLDRLPAKLAVSERWLIGHSFSALFGLSALFRGSTTFQKWLLASPSIWWDDKSILELEASYAALNQDLLAQVFVCYGEHEHNPAEQDFRMGQNAEELLETLHGRSYPSLRLSNAVIAGDDHASSVGGAVSKGLRALK